MRMKPNSLFRAALALFAVVILASCSSAPSWLEGNWVLDSERTQKDDSATSAPADAGTFPSNMLSGMTAMLRPMLLQQLSGMELLVTNKERVFTVGGQGKSESYTIMEKSSDKCVLKLKDGTVETYYRSGDDIYMYGTGGTAFKIFLKREK